MARKRVIDAQSLKSWEDVNDALRQIAEAQIALGDIESDMQKQIVGAKKVAEDQSKPYKDAIARLEHELKEFVSEHRTDMGKTKTMTLTFGEVGFRLSTSVSLPKAKEKLAEIIRRLKARQMTDCIVVEEKISKDALKKYGEDTVNAVGAVWKQKDEFGYLPELCGSGGLLRLPCQGPQPGEERLPVCGGYPREEQSHPGSPEGGSAPAQ